MDLEKQVFSEIGERGRQAQRKTIDGIFEFAQAVKDMHDAAETVQGGTRFSQLCKEEWGISKDVSSMWLKIGRSLDKLSALGPRLPPSYRAIYELLKLDESHWSKISVGPSITRADIESYRLRLRQDKFREEASSRFNRETAKEKPKEKPREAPREEKKEKPGTNYGPRLEITEEEAIELFGGIPHTELALNCLYKCAAQRFHPDKGGDTEKFKMLQKAKAYFEKYIRDLEFFKQHV